MEQLGDHSKGEDGGFPCGGVVKNMDPFLDPFESGPHVNHGPKRVLILTKPHVSLRAGFRFRFRLGANVPLRDLQFSQARSVLANSGVPNGPKKQINTFKHLLFPEPVLLGSFSTAKCFEPKTGNRLQALRAALRTHKSQTPGRNCAIFAEMGGSEFLLFLFFAANGFLFWCVV